MTNLKKLNWFLTKANCGRRHNLISLAEAVELIGKANRESAVCIPHSPGDSVVLAGTYMAIQPMRRRRYMLTVWHARDNNSGQIPGANFVGGGRFAWLDGGEFITTARGLAKMVLEYKAGLAQAAAAAIDPATCGMPLRILADWMRDREHVAHADALEDYA